MLRIEENRMVRDIGGGEVSVSRQRPIFGSGCSSRS
jgi:hypothetical protein